MTTNKELLCMVNTLTLIRGLCSVGYHPKLTINPNLVKPRLLITYLLLDRFEISQSASMIRPCSIEQLKRMLWTNGFSWDLTDILYRTNHLAVSSEISISVVKLFLKCPNFQNDSTCEQCVIGKISWGLILRCVSDGHPVLYQPTALNGTLYVHSTW